MSSWSNTGFTFVEDVTSDLCFEARAPSLPELFACAAEALLEATLAEPTTLRETERASVELEEPNLDLLLLRFLNELVYLRDARDLLLRARVLRIATGPPARLAGELCGERIDRDRHQLELDVKAVTAHGLRVQQRDGLWTTRVTLDV